MSDEKGRTPMERPSREWLEERVAIEEGSPSISVGGLAADMGMLSPPDTLREKVREIIVAHAGWDVGLRKALPASLDGSTTDDAATRIHALYALSDEERFATVELALYERINEVVDSGIRKWHGAWNYTSVDMIRWVALAKRWSREPTNQMVVDELQAQTEVVLKKWAAANKEWFKRGKPDDDTPLRKKAKKKKRKRRRR